MMKKLLAVTLVLGLAVVANAAVSWDLTSQDVVIGDSITVTVSSDDAEPYGGFVFMDNALGGIDNLVVFPAAGPDAAWTTPDLVGVPGYWMHEAKSFNPAVLLVAGEHFTFDYTAVGEGPVDIQLLDFSTNVLATATITNVVPEPMTLGLLGLGGLFLRRRK